MSGNSLLVDTNIALYLLAGDERVAELLHGRDLFLSFITELELLGFRALSRDEEATIMDLVSRCTVVNITPEIKQITIAIRRAHTVKLPDAIIAATAVSLGLPLLSADRGFTKIGELIFLQYGV